MKIITLKKEMRSFSKSAKEEGKSIGFVPTMGFLHEGHLSLIRASKKECDLTVLSIFVNPTQFAPEEDFEKYPRDMEKDKLLAEKEEVDILFAPAQEEIYPKGDDSSVEVKGRISEGLCGASRPGHFKGVATVVARLFDIVQPARSYFGEKDFQQAAVIKKMVKDLNLPVEVRTLPIVREKDGLAMSSRNSYLSQEERKEALALFHSLEKAKALVEEGELSSARIKEQMENILTKGKNTRVDYIEIVDKDTMESVRKIKNNTLIAVAAFVGSTRLIDNVTVERPA